MRVVKGDGFLLLDLREEQMRNRRLFSIKQYFSFGEIFSAPF